MILSKKYLCLLAALVFSTPLLAQTDAAKKEIQLAQEEAVKVLIKGPENIRLKDQANFSLPQNTGFVPAAAAARYLNAMGNVVDEKSLLGLVVPLDGKSEWFAQIALQQDGYVRDDDASHWKAEDMLQSLQQGTEHANAARKERGIPELEVSGWAELPNYDTSTHRLYWSATVRNKGDAPSDADFVNYRTIALGRDGFLSLTLVTRLSQLAQEKRVANHLLANMNFDEGKRYTDFSASTDRIAEYGLGALIVGVAAKKIGLIAVILAFAAKFLKIGLLAAAGFGIAIKKFFARKPKVAKPASVPAVPMQSVDTTAPGSDDKPNSTPTGPL